MKKLPGMKNKKFIGKKLSKNDMISLKGMGGPGLESLSSDIEVKTMVLTRRQGGGCSDDGDVEDKDWSSGSSL